jgi:hypothetical protein
VVFPKNIAGDKATYTIIASGVVQVSTNKPSIDFLINIYLGQNLINVRVDAFSTKK